MKAWERGGLWQPEPGWTHSTKRHAVHACGWSCTHRAEDVGAHRAAIDAHAAVCPWPEHPEPVDTAEG